MTWEKFKAMSFQKKMEHIWEYYRWHIAAVLLLILFFGSWIHSAVTRKEPLLQLQMINAYGETPGGEAFAPFFAEQGIEYSEGAVEVAKNIQMMSSDPSMNMASMEMLMCTLAAGEPDLIFWDSDQLLPSLKGALLDLREIFPEDFLRQYQDRLVYDRPEEGGEAYPCAIYLPENPWILQQKYYVNCSVSLSYSCKDLNLASGLIRWLLSAEKS